MSDASEPSPANSVHHRPLRCDGTVTEAHLRTDAEGVVRLRVSPGHVYLLDAVIMRPAPAEADAAWLSLWAALSFAVPPAR